MSTKYKFKANEIRLLRISQHYRKNFNFTINGIHAMQKHIDNIQNTYLKINKPDQEINTEINTKEYKEKINKSMRDDLNTPQALAHFLELIKNINKGLQSTKKDIKKSKKKIQNLLNSIVFTAIIFGINLQKTIDIIHQYVINLSKERTKFKDQKKYIEADKIRDDLIKKGYELKDTENKTEINKIK